MSEYATTDNDGVSSDFTGALTNTSSIVNSHCGVEFLPQTIAANTGDGETTIKNYMAPMLATALTVAMLLLV